MNNQKSIFANVPVSHLPIKPEAITKYNRNRRELENFLVFAIVVAGKKSDVQASKLREFYASRVLHDAEHMGLFDYIRYLKSNFALVPELQLVKMGQYIRISNALSELVDKKLNLFTCSLEDLVSVKGISLKTANFFLTHTRATYSVPVLDTHVLKFLKDQGVENVPKSTPQVVKVYNFFADKFVAIAKRLGMTVADLDLQVWKKYSKSTIRG